MVDDDIDATLNDSAELSSSEYLVTAELGGSPAEPVRKVGRYRLLQRLGEGGMGEVYHAEQETPVRRMVALKLIKQGMDTKQVVARFASERQALAMMDHPCIARVYDAGATEQGRPYFAMEYVRGVPITEYCDKNRLATRERLELFIHICEGIQHAHQKGIIHRDLKPSNVLITIQDDKPIPKIIDFGVAKATAQRLTEQTMFTALGQIIGTPEYMSPEQAEMSGLDVDTRTDVYSLGVLLYELLAGELPFATKELRQGGFNEFRRRILEEEPPRPSTRVQTLGPASRTAGEHRRTDHVALSRLLRGDLDWITMKALEKDRTRRYASASELAQDIRRYLSHEPVLASPPSNLYRAGKFVRRHKAGASFAAVLVVLLVGSAVSMAVQSRWLAAEADRARAAEARAVTEAATAQRVIDFLNEMFQVSGPDKARGNDITAREILDQAAEKIRTDLGDQPPVQAQMMHTIGTVYYNLGLYGKSRPLLETALRIREGVLRKNDPAIADTLTNLAHVLVSDDGDYDGARRLYERALAIRQETLSADHPAVAASMSNLANMLAVQGNIDRALELTERAYEIRKKALVADDPGLAQSLHNLATLLKKRGQIAEARPLYQQALDIRERVLGRDHPDVATSLSALGQLHVMSGDYERARPLYERALEIRQKVLGPAHPSVATSLITLAMLRARQGDLREAETYHRSARKIFDASLSGDKPAVLYQEACYASLVGQYDTALKYLRKSVVDGRFSGIEVLLEDPDLIRLHGEPEFDRIVAEVRQRESSDRIAAKVGGP